MNDICDAADINSGTGAEKAEDRRIRGIHLHSTLGVYGAERWTLALLKHIDQEEFDLSVMSIGVKQGADAFYQQLIAEGFSAFHISLPGKLNPRAILKLRDIMRQEKTDILHTHGFKADVLGYMATRGTPVRLVSTIHGWSEDESRLIRFYEAVSRAFLKHFDCVYPLSPALLQTLQQRGFDPHRLRLVLNSVDLSGLEFRINPRNSMDPFSVLFVGRICRPKGVFDLVEAFSLAKLPASSHLHIVGDGEDVGELETFIGDLGIADKVTLAGATSSVPEYLADSHVLVLPSYAEGIPRAIMEAFAAGTPVVGTDIPGIRQLIEDEVTGLLAPVGDTGPLARAIERLCNNPELARLMAENARLVVEKSYSAKRMAQDFQSEYRELCSMK
jgi:glycosyltransferase involved in cell wall biosynthesis